ncbi:unnamed protein product, partial [Pleuronectes platessa]
SIRCPVPKVICCSYTSRVRVGSSGSTRLEIVAVGNVSSTKGPETSRAPSGPSRAASWNGLAGIPPIGSSSFSRRRSQPEISVSNPHSNPKTLSCDSREMTSEICVR